MSRVLNMDRQVSMGGADAFSGACPLGHLDFFFFFSDGGREWNPLASRAVASVVDTVGVGSSEGRFHV